METDTMIVNSRSTVDANKAVITNWFEGLSGERELDYALIASDVVNHTASALGLRDGAENFRRVMGIVQVAAPDQKWKIQRLIAEGDLVACRVTWSGTAGPSLACLERIAPSPLSTSTSSASPTAGSRSTGRFVT